MQHVTALQMSNPISHIPASKLEAQSQYFVCPEWGAKPQPGWYLDVRKGLTSIGQHPIDQHPYYLLGRNVKVVDYVLEHPSISRVHVALVHHQSGSLFLIEMGTKYGTTINGKAAPKLSPVKLHVGDSFKVAESSREYVVMNASQPDLPAKGVSPVTDPVDEQVPAKEATALNSRPKGLNAEASTVVSVKRLASDNDASGSAPEPAQLAKKPRVGASQEGVEVIQCSHIVLKHSLCQNAVDRDKLPVTRNKQVALAMIADFRQQVVEIEEPDARLGKLSQLAKAHSDCGASWKLGGKLPPVRRGVLNEAFEDTAFALSVGEVSKPVETEMGIHVIMRVS
jgi:hypothetical protein|uniref:Peptidylprolyl isomerase n=1 Tax=Eutreptiella gymnastica TaxID=73025 RepID=A0A7S4LMV6_9EUGL|mmetsp:Transcript_101881/g.172602  ORF Transcript_101881/g.172602 Transcript_101881/m.172602 type:complete len:339 (+) Transcript_101881:72-1088(+)